MGHDTKVLKIYVRIDWFCLSNSSLLQAGRIDSWPWDTVTDCSDPVLNGLG